MYASTGDKRFADKGGVVKIDDTTALMTANIQASVSLADTKYSQALQIRVGNTSALNASLNNALAAVAHGLSFSLCLRGHRVGLRCDVIGELLTNC